jgi:phosphoserine phosphatase
MTDFSRWIVFDCDSTLSAIEGVDELGALRGPEVFQACERMTLDAMEGRIPIESVFAERLRLIQPREDEVARVGKKYVATVEPTVQHVLAELRQEQWGLAILSGGFTQAIAPLADYLGISKVEAVPLLFDARGNYAGYGEEALTARSGGKPEMLARWRREHDLERIVMVGDGSSDLETKGEADLFVGFGRYIRRPKVEEGADAFIFSMDELPKLLRQRFS